MVLTGKSDLSSAVDMDSRIGRGQRALLPVATSRGPTGPAWHRPEWRLCSGSGRWRVSIQCSQSDPKRPVAGTHPIPRPECTTCQTCSDGRTWLARSAKAPSTRHATAVEAFPEQFAASCTDPRTAPSAGARECQGRHRHHRHRERDRDAQTRGPTGQLHAGPVADPR